MRISGWMAAGAAIRSATSAANAAPGSAVYDVPSVSTAPAEGAGIDDPAWSPSTVISGTMHYPWERVAAPETRFRAVHDASTLFFTFEVTDDHVLALDQPRGERETIDAEDRVELFFAPGPIDRPGKDGKLPPYYAVEIDATGRVHDYSMVYYRNIDSSWSMPGLKASGSKTDTGYRVTASIPLQSLRDLGLIDRVGDMRTGVYRAEFSGDIAKPEMQWISWVDPQTPEPDFHVDSSFGVFRLLE